jgi:hypothetical protein
VCGGRGLVRTKGVLKAATSALNLKCWLVSPQILVLPAIDQEMKAEKKDEESDKIGDGGDNIDSRDRRS